MGSSSLLRCCAIILALVVLTAELTTAAPSPYGDYDDIRDLYELLLRNGARGDRLSHQVVRKGGRDPSLRLRFGRRADPAWQSLASSESGDTN